ncbi:MAG TPA: hypothetical protein VJ950_00895, partial [Acidimicrobiia bacterium]|nr:hypothetical protein [Acidimicrobiia bacterium]
MNTRKHGGPLSRPSVLLIMAIVMAMMVGACADSGAEETTTSAAAEETTTSAAAEETTTSAAAEDTTTSAAAEALAVTCEPTAADAEGALIMWERTGGNAQMVDALVCAWNGRNPDRPISLEY